MVEKNTKMTFVKRNIILSSPSAFAEGLSGFYTFLKKRRTFNDKCSIFKINKVKYGCVRVDEIPSSHMTTKYSNL